MVQGDHICSLHICSQCEIATNDVLYEVFMTSHQKPEVKKYFIPVYTAYRHVLFEVPVLMLNQSNIVEKQFSFQ